MVGHIVESADPERGPETDRRRLGRKGTRHLKVPRRISWQRRMGIDATSLQCHPERTEITLFEDMHRNAVLLCQRNRRPMHWTLISKHNEIANIVTPQNLSHIGR